MARSGNSSRAHTLSAAPWRAILTSLRSRRSAIVAHHGVGDGPAGNDPFELRVPVWRFRTQVELLLEAGFEFVTVAEFAERSDGSEPPPGLIALSFDDGMADNHTVLLPLLQEYGISATIYVTTGLLGKPNPWMSSELMLSAKQVRELAAAGVEVGAHSVTHPDMEELDEESCLREMVESADELERITGSRPRTFAYPFCRYGPQAVRAARRAGFEAAVTCARRGGWDRFELRRALMRGSDPLPIFIWKIAGSYERAYETLPSRVGRRATRTARQRLKAWRADRGAE